MGGLDGMSFGGVVLMQKRGGGHVDPMQDSAGD